MSESISFQCYSCNQVLKVGAEKAGKRGKCPKCGTALTIPLESSIAADPKSSGPKSSVPKPAAPRPAPPPAVSARPLRAEMIDDEPEEAPLSRGQRVAEEEEEIAERFVRRSGSSWAMVGIGLLIVFIAFCVIAGGFLFLVIADLIATIMAFGSGSLGMLKTAMNLERIGVIVFLLGAVGALVGYIFCIIGPNKEGTRPLAIVTTALVGVFILLDVLARFAMAPDPFGPPRSVLGHVLLMMFGQIVLGASMILSPLYLGAALRAKKRARYASPQAALGLGIAYTGVIVLALLFVFLPASRPMAYIGLFVRWIKNGVFIGYLISFILLVWNVRGLTSSR